MAALTTEQLATIASGLPAAGLAGWWYAPDATDSDHTMPGGAVVKLKGDVPPRSGDAEAADPERNAVVSVAEGDVLRGFRWPDGAWGPQMGGQMDEIGSSPNQYRAATGTAFPLGSQVTRGHTCYFTIAASLSESRPEDVGANQLTHTTTFVLYESADDAQRLYLSMEQGTNAFGQLLGRFGSGNFSAAAPLDVPIQAWPNYSVLAVRVADDGAVTLWIDGVLAWNTGQTVTNRTVPRDMAMALGRDLGGTFTATGSTVGWLHAVAYSEAHSDATISTMSNLLLTGQPAKDASRPLIIAVGDSITSGFRSEGGLTWAHYAADEIGAQLVTLAKPSRTITSPEYFGGGVLDDSVVGRESAVDTAIGHILDHYPASSYTLALFMGTNDTQNDAAGTVASIVTAYEAWVDAAVAIASNKGVTLKVVALTIYDAQTSSWDATTDTRRAAFNAALLASDRFHAVADIASVVVEDNDFDESDDLHIFDQAGLGTTAAAAIQSVLSVAGGLAPRRTRARGRWQRR